MRQKGATLNDCLQHFKLARSKGGDTIKMEQDVANLAALHIEAPLAFQVAFFKEKTGDFVRLYKWSEFLAVVDARTGFSGSPDDAMSRVMVDAVSSALAAIVASAPGDEADSLANALMVAHKLCASLAEEGSGIPEPSRDHLRLLGMATDPESFDKDGATAGLRELAEDDSYNGVLQPLFADDGRERFFEACCCGASGNLLACLRRVGRLFEKCRAKVFLAADQGD